jgi:hypothetical protein
MAMPPPAVVATVKPMAPLTCRKRRRVIDWCTGEAFDMDETPCTSEQHSRIRDMHCR